MRAFLSVCAAILVGGASAETYRATSPDGRNEIVLCVTTNVTYSVRRAGRTLVVPSPIALSVGGHGVLGESSPCVTGVDRRVETGVIDTPIYKKSSVSLAANRVRVSFDGGWGVDLAARDDGVAYRFVTDFPEADVRVMDERAGLELTGAETVSYVGLARNHFSSNEAVYRKMTPGEWGTATNRLFYLPLVAVYGGGTSLCVTESDTRSYPQLMFAGSSNRLESAFARLPDPAADEDNGRKRLVRKTFGWIADTRGTRTYPWRVFALAESPVGLCECDIVYALAEPCAQKGDLSWIRPGKVAWDWWNCWNLKGVPFRAGINTETYLHYVDFAAEHGLEYVIMDEGWSVRLKVMEMNPDVDVARIVRHANEKGVGIILWCSWPQLVGRQHEVFSRYAALGVKGFKIDFINRDDQYAEDFLETTARIAAEYRLVIDYHGVHKPTGLQRTYPNILNYEGVYGLENAKTVASENVDFPASDLLSFCCRMSAGPMDYTPGAMRNMVKTDDQGWIRSGFKSSYNEPGSQGTRVHQMALMSLYEAPLQMLCDSPSQYRENLECFSFMSKVPVVWDETRGLSGSMDDYVLAARRKGDVWYLSAIGSWTPQAFEASLSFLGSGAWRAEIFEDGPNADRDATDYVHRFVEVTSDSKLPVRLAPGGGFTVRLCRGSSGDGPFAVLSPEILNRWFDAFAADDEELYTNAYPNAVAKESFGRKVPLFECPDEDITRTYYFRWWTFRKHLRKSPSGWVVTEFLPDVPWAGKYNTISCPFGHHLREGRWIRDATYLDDYTRIMLREGNVNGPKAYASWPAWGTLERARLSGDRRYAQGLLPDFVRNYRAWEAGWTSRGVSLKSVENRRGAKSVPIKTGFRPERGLFDFPGDREGSEFALSADGARPLVNSALWAEATAIAEIAGWAGEAGLVEEFSRKAASLRENILGRLWNPDVRFFTSLSVDGVHDDVCELHGYAPFYFRMPLGRELMEAWRPLTEETGFLAPRGLTFPMRKTPGFDVTIDLSHHECLWNGPSWPYATSVALTALYESLQGETELPIGKEAFGRLLRQYAQQQVRVLPDGRRICWIDENLDPFTGEWIARTHLRAWDQAGIRKLKYPERGKDYNHSTFCDLVIAGLCGFIPHADGSFEVCPLAPSEWDWWCVDGIRFHGRDIAVLFDRDGTRYGKGYGLVVLEGGTAISNSLSPTKGFHVVRPLNPAISR